MINTTIFKSAFIFLVLTSSAMSKPVEITETDIIQSSKPSTEATPVVSGDHYDQRQNGTKNFRLHVDGVVVVVAPAQALLLAGELDPASLMGLGGLGSAISSEADSKNAKNRKPLDIEDAEEKPIRQKSAHSHGFRLSNLLGPLLRHISP